MKKCIIYIYNFFPHKINIICLCYGHFCINALVVSNKMTFCNVTNFHTYSHHSWLTAHKNSCGNLFFLFNKIKVNVLKYFY